MAVQPEPISLEKSKIEKAVAALRQMSGSLKEGKDLLDKVKDVELQMCLKKIPRKEKTIKLKLAHSTKKTDLEVCLFVKDLNKEEREYDATVRHFEDELKKKGVTSITEIVPLKALKTEYKPYEAKRNLSNAFDVFLADARIIRLLPAYLGKSFYGRKRLPIQVNLEAKSLSDEVESALSNGRCYIGTKGSVSTSVVAHLDMGNEEITQNVVDSASQISKHVDGGPDNIKIFCLKLKESTSLPIYICAGGPQGVIIPPKQKREDVEAEEIDTLFGAKVMVYPSGHIKVINDKGEEIDEDGIVKMPRFSSKSKNRKRKAAELKKKGVKKSMVELAGQKTQKVLKAVNKTVDGENKKKVKKAKTEKVIKQVDGEKIKKVKQSKKTETMAKADSKKMTLSTKKTVTKKVVGKKMARESKVAKKSKSS